MSTIDQIAENIAQNMLKSTKERKFKRSVSNPVDYIVTAMEEAEKADVNGLVKSEIAKRVIEIVVIGGYSIIPDSVINQLRSLIDSDLLPSVFKGIAEATKGFTELNIPKRINCFGC